MGMFSLFKRSKQERQVQTQVQQEAAAPKKPVCTLGLDENGDARGIFKDERIHMAVAGFPGTGKCLLSQTPVLTSRGLATVRVIHRYLGKADYHVPTMKGFSRIKACSREKYDGELVYIRTSMGRHIRVTAEHRIAVFSNGFITLKEAKDIKAGDQLITPRILETHSVGFNPELCELLGYLLSEGSIARAGTSMVSLKTEEIIQRLEELLPKYAWSFSKSFDRKVPVFYIPNGFLVHLEEYFGRAWKINSNSAKKSLPPRLLIGTERAKISFLKAYILGDGYLDKRDRYVGITTISRRMTKDLSYLLVTLGLVPKVVRKRNEKSRSGYVYELVLRGEYNLKRYVELGLPHSDVVAEWVKESDWGKSHPKAEVLERFVLDPVSRRCFQKFKGYVYDIQIEDPSGLFYAGDFGGILLHNSRFLLSLALQNVVDGEGLLIMDPHGDLVKIFLSHIPRQRWGDVVYIDPTTAMNYGRLVKVNFLEYSDPKDRDVVARSFMESLEKIYTRFWGPRLDMILMNAIYALLDAGDTNLSNLYRVIADDAFREDLTSKISDERVKSFWEGEFKRMPRDASGAALTKIYRIVQERIVAPMFECKHSMINFREAMDKKKIIVVNLSEGAITSDVANFLGSLILARVYLAGMSREDTPEDKRVPFYIYVDEAPRFVSMSIRDILQSLRKYRVYMTLASQYLGQYTKEIADSIPHLCDTIICFSAGEDTAKTVEEFYKPSLSYEDLTHLPMYTFAASAMIGRRRECQVLKSIDYGWGPNDVEEVIKNSLQKWGEEVDMSRYFGVPAVGELPHPDNMDLRSPIPWIILLKLYRLYEENLGSGMYSVGTMPSIENDDLVEALHSDFGISEVEVATAINNLSIRAWIQSKEHSYEKEGVMVPVEAPWHPTPLPCEICGELTSHPYMQRNGKALCKICLEEALLKRKKLPEDFMSPFIDSRQLRFDLTVQRRTKRRFYSLTPFAKQVFFDQVPRGRRGGGPEHSAVIGELARSMWDEYSFCFVDVGEETPRKKPDGTTEYETKKLPDILVYPLAKTKDGKTDPRHWGNSRSFTVEVEIDPVKHQQRAINNLKKCRNWGKPVMFATTKPEWARGLVRILQEHSEQVVQDCTGWRGGIHDPKKVSVLYIDLESKTETSVASPETPLTAEEIKGGIKPLGQTEETQVVNVRAEAGDERDTLLAFNEPSWRYVVKWIDGKATLTVNKHVGTRMMTFIIGPYEKFREEIERLKLRVAFEQPPEEKKGEAEEKATEGKVEGEGPGKKEKELEKEAKAKAEQPQIEAPKPTLEPTISAPAPTKGGTQPVKTETEKMKEKTKPLTPEEKLRKYAALQYRFRVTKRGNRLLLYADKWIKSEKKTDTQYIGAWDDKLKKLGEELGTQIMEPVGSPRIAHRL
jgi:intein/homing endonuclease